MVQAVRKSLKMLAEGAGPLFVQGACETISRCRRGHVYHPAKCYYAIRPWEIPRPECTTRSKRLQNREEKMPLFITYASYSHSGVKGLVNKPEDRSGAVKALIEKAGGKLVSRKRLPELLVLTLRPENNCGHARRYKAPCIPIAPTHRSSSGCTRRKA